MPANSTKYTRMIMGMPVSVEIVGDRVPRRLFDMVFDWFEDVDRRYSPYKPDSEVSRMNAGLPEDEWSDEMRAILALSTQTKALTDGYFDVYFQGHFDPSGIIKGWAIQKAAELLKARGRHDFYIDAGGDIAAAGTSPEGNPWRIGIRNPFRREEVIKVIAVQDKGVATSGAYIRGDHIYNPRVPGERPAGIVSLTVIGPDVYEADRFATAAYAMGSRGIAFINGLEGFEGYMVTPDGMATMTRNFERYMA